MAEGIVYLDVDDEITSAAQRIRSTPGTKVALVVPNGSRIATSRINFRLLSREALVSNRRLSVIAPDPAARALAASAGLPVFATIAEYESALAGPKAATAEDLTPFAAPVTVVDERAPEPAAKPNPPRRATKGGAAAAAASSSGTAAPDDTVRMAVPRAAPVGTLAPRHAVRDDTRPPVATGGGRRIRTPVIVTVAAIAFAAILVGVAGYLFLPSATIALTPRQEPIEIPLTVEADPTATAVDVANSKVPALRLDVPVRASQTFTTTGTHVELSPAKGDVTFTNRDTGGSNTIAAGSIVSTEGGNRFRTLASVTLPPAQLDPIFQPSTRSVAIEALRDGPAGNVPANTIRIVPQGENPVLLLVNNPDPTSGGSRTETPEIKKAEVDKAVAAMQKAIQTSFTDAIAAGAGAPDGTELFPATATPGTPTFTTDPNSLIGKAVETFDLEISAKGTVTAVDSSPVRSIAETRLRERIGADHRLVDGSIQIDIAEGTVGEDGLVTFTATARAVRVLVVDPAQLRGLVKGRSIADAEAALAPYGEARVSLWPAWVTTVTGVDARLSIKVDETPAQSGGSSRSASPAPTPSRAPVASRSPGSAAP